MHWNSSIVNPVLNSQAKPITFLALVFLTYNGKVKIQSWMYLWVLGAIGEVKRVNIG